MSMATEKFPSAEMRTLLRTQMCVSITVLRGIVWFPPEKDGNLSHPFHSSKCILFKIPSSAHSALYPGRCCPIPWAFHPHVFASLIASHALFQPVSSHASVAIVILAVSLGGGGNNACLLSGKLALLHSHTSLSGKACVPGLESTVSYFPYRYSN